MSEFNQEPNQNNKETFDAKYTETSHRPVKQKKSHPFLTVLVAAVVGCGAGLGGTWFTITHMGMSGTTINYTSQDSPSSATAVSSNTSGVGLTTAEVAEKASPSVVEIVTTIQTTSYGMFGGTSTAQAAGSGVIISSDGYIITNNHVVEDSTEITVTTYDGKEYTAELIGTDEKSDIAVIKIKATNLTAATIGDSAKLAVGDTAVAIGNPLGTLGGTVTDGIISSTSRELVINNQSMELLQTNASINSGNSGGGLFDGNGNLIGIVNAKDSGTTSSGTTIEGIGFAIPINKAMDIASQLMESGKVTNRPTLGVHIQQISQATQHYDAGLYITDIVAGSGAEAAGLQAYDQIIKADSTSISSYSDLTAVLNKKNVGDTIDITVIRDGKEKVFSVTLTSVIDEPTSES